MNTSEHILLGGFMWNQGAMWLNQTRPEWFSTIGHQHICATVQRMFAENKHVDLTSVCNEIKNLVQPHEVAEIYTAYSGQEISQHWAVVRQEFTRREITKLLEAISDTISTSDPYTLLNTLQSSLDGLQLTESGQSVKLDTLLEQRLENLADRRKKKIKTVGVPTGYAKLDRYIGGFVPSETVVVAARPGMGKTAFAVCIGLAHARQGGRVLMFSIEMSKEQLGDRILAQAGQMDNLAIRAAEMTDYQFEAIASGMDDYKLNFEIEASPHITIDQIRARVKCMNPRPTLVIIDYLQLVHSVGKRNREQEISYISRQCKLIAKDCGCTVMPIAQLNRETEDGNPRPRLKNLRESGAIEQDADTVLFPFRPQYYNNEKDLPDIEEDCQLIIAKCRNGMTGNLELFFRGKTVEYLWPK